MQIIDKYGYLDGALDYIEKHLVSGRGLQQIAKKARINEDLIKNLSLALKDFSEKRFLTTLQDKIEERRASGSGIQAEISQVDLSIESEQEPKKRKSRVFILINLTSDIVVDGEVEDRIKSSIKVFSRSDIK